MNALKLSKGLLGDGWWGKRGVGGRGVRIYFEWNPLNCNSDRVS
jgi:hypothetical protein